MNTTDDKKTKSITFNVQSDIKQQLLDIAKNQDRTLKAILKHAVRDYINKCKADKKGQTGKDYF
jgi:predicted transcriptional regulator